MKQFLAALVFAFCALVANAADPVPLAPSDIPRKAPLGAVDQKKHWSGVKDKYDGKAVSFAGKIVGIYEDKAKGCYCFGVSTTYTVDRGKELQPLTETSAVVNVYLTENSRPLQEEFLAATKAKKVITLNVEGVLAVEQVNARNGESRLVLNKSEVKKKETTDEKKR